MSGKFEALKIDVYGESHSETIGVILEGIPAGSKIYFSEIKGMLKRRAPIACVGGTARRENDSFEFKSGVTTQDGNTVIADGTPIEAVIKNVDIKKDDYINILSVPRPSHSDFAAFKRDGFISSGGGRFSGRMTAPLCIAGGVAKAILKTAGIEVAAYTSAIGGIEIYSYKNCDIDKIAILNASNNSLKCVLSKNNLLTEKMAVAAEDKIAAAAKLGDSVGGAIECICFGVPAGSMGDNLFEGLEGKIAYSVFAVPGIKGVEFGDGFLLAEAYGSAANDAIIRGGGASLAQTNEESVGNSDTKEQHLIITATNKSGGINGGISNGMPLLMRAAVRPTPSIALNQKSVDLKTGKEVELKITGRHDACIVPRAVVAVESAVALALLDEALMRGLIT